MESLTNRVRLYRDLLDERGTTIDPDKAALFDHANARMRHNILADAIGLGAQQHALIDLAIEGIDDAHKTRYTRPAPIRPAQEQPAEAKTAPTDQEPVRRYEVIVGTAAYIKDFPDKAARTYVADVDRGFAWALDELGDTSKGWPKTADLHVEVRNPVTREPIYTAEGPLGMVTDEVVEWRAEERQHDRDMKLSRLHDLVAERDQYRRERDEAVHKLATLTPEKDRYGSAHQQTAAPSHPGQNAAQPSFATPTFAVPTFAGPYDGLDR